MQRSPLIQAYPLTVSRKSIGRVKLFDLSLFLTQPPQTYSHYYWVVCPEHPGNKSS